MVKLSSNLGTENIELYEIDKIATRCQNKSQFANCKYKGLDRDRIKPDNIFINSERKGYYIRFIFNDSELEGIISRVKKNEKGEYIVDSSDVTSLINNYIKIYSSGNRSILAQVINETNRVKDYFNVLNLKYVLDCNTDVIEHIAYGTKTDKSPELFLKELSGNTTGRSANLKYYDYFRHAYRCLQLYNIKYNELERKKLENQSKTIDNDQNIAEYYEQMELDRNYSNIGSFDEFWAAHQDEYSSIEEAEEAYYGEQPDSPFSIFHK